MLEATSYGLIALGLILVAAFCFVWVEEKAARQANRSPRLVEKSKKNSFSSAGNETVCRSRRGFAGRETLTGAAQVLHATSLTQACPRSPDGDSPAREQGSSGASHG
jgi:hypothetical protein